MNWQRITNVVNRIGDFIHEGKSPIHLRVEAVWHYLEYLQLNANNIFKNVVEMLRAHLRGVGKGPLGEWICLSQNDNKLYEVNNNKDLRLTSNTASREEQSLWGGKRNDQNDNARTWTKEEEQMQANVELARFLGLAMPTVHSAINWQFWFENCFWHLIIGNSSILFNFYQQRLVFAWKIHSRPTKTKKANEGHKRPSKARISKNHWFHQYSM